MLPIKLNSRSLFSFKKKLIIYSSIGLILKILSYQWLTLDTFKTFRIRIYDAMVGLYLKQMGFQIESLYIDVSYKSLRKIHFKREQAMSIRLKTETSTGILLKSTEDFVFRSQLLMTI